MIQKKSIGFTFDQSIELDDSLTDKMISFPFITRVYTVKRLYSDSNTGQIIVVDALFVTKLVEEMDFCKEASRDPMELLQKVKDKMLLCKTTPEDPDTICFLRIIADFKASNFGKIFKAKGIPLLRSGPGCCTRVPQLKCGCMVGISLLKVRPTNQSPIYDILLLYKPEY